MKEGSEDVDGEVMGHIVYRVVSAWKDTAAVKLNTVSHWCTAQASVITDDRWTPLATLPLLAC